MKHVFCFQFKLFMYNFVLFVQKEISPTWVRKIIFDHLIIKIGSFQDNQEIVQQHVISKLINIPS